MPTDVIMPQMGESIFEGTITKWLKKPGDQVQRDEPLFEISTDKVDAEIPSPVAGVLSEIKVPEGSTVQINTVVAVIGEAGSATASAPAASKPAPQAEAPKPPAPTAQSDGAPSKAETATPAQSSAPAAASTSGGTPVVMPQMGESIFEGTITKWLKKVGDTVQRDEPLFEISTDKVDAEIPSPISGVLSAIAVPEGSTVQINTVVATIGGTAGAAGASAPAVARSEGAAASAASTATAVAPPAASSTLPSVSASAANGASAERLRSSPLVRRIAKDNNVDLAQIPGSGSAGRITKDDILGFIDKHGAGQAAPVASTPAAAPAAQTAARPAPAPAAAPLPGSLEPMSKMRAIIARRMVESKQTSAHVHTVFKVDMTRIVKLREKEKNKYEQRNGIKLTYMPFIASAVVSALKKFPIVNASVEGDAVRYHANINLGIAVALEWGLIVPVIKQAENQSFLGIARSIVDLAERARNKKLKPDEVADGTFTLTNSGIFGELFGTPIIAQPQTAILGIGGLSKEPAVITADDGTDSIAIRNIQHFTLGFDHRIIDGADAGKFMSEFKKALEGWSQDIG
jgi:2-oxoglutarate dehydrogenase E2 component (dihydrolipoamide succinyltransferase)